jgi:hypothetical protein
MILYKPTNKIFPSRKELKKYLGSNRYKRLLEHKPDVFEFINPNIAINETTELSSKELHSYDN